MSDVNIGEALGAHHPEATAQATETRDTQGIYTSSSYPQKLASVTALPLAV